MATFSSVTLHGKRMYNNLSSNETNGNTSKLSKILSKEEQYRWSFPADVSAYANENSKKFMLYKATLREATLLKSPKPENNDLVKKLDEFFLELPEEKKKTLDINIVSISENIQDCVTGIIGASSKLWVIIENPNSARAGEAPAALKNTVLELLEKTFVLVSQM